MQTLLIYTVHKVRKILYFPLDLNPSSLGLMRFIVRIDAPLRRFLLRGRYEV